MGEVKEGKLGAIRGWFESAVQHPALRDIQLNEGGESLALTTTGGQKARLRLDDVIADLQRMLDERSVAAPV